MGQAVTRLSQFLADNDPKVRSTVDAALACVDGQVTVRPHRHDLELQPGDVVQFGDWHAVVPPSAVSEPMTPQGGSAGSEGQTRVTVGLPGNWWISWYACRADGPFELHTPWWVSGLRIEDGAATIVAAVQAHSDNGARELIYASYDTRPKVLEFRFCELMPSGWSPFSDRFPQADWMTWEPSGSC